MTQNHACSCAVDPKSMLLHLFHISLQMGSVGCVYFTNQRFNIANSE